MDTLQVAVDNLSIQSVNLRESNTLVRNNIDIIVFNDLDRKDLTIQSYRRVGQVKEVVVENNGNDQGHYEYFYSYNVGLRLVPSNEIDKVADDEYVPPVEVKAVFESRYLSPFQLTTEALEAFAEQNVGYHIWPYWREFIQSMTPRLGITGGIVVPHYLVMKNNSPQKSDIVKE
jgi:hypothetical protein